jgi:DNA mismatch repair protein MutS
MKKDTPMMKQYHRIKNRYRDAILLFRLGDFYEMFEKDALVASSILNITLTKRNSVPMCGFPFHAADTYIARLIKHGEKIAICEQQENPEAAKVIVKREVVEILSPGIILDPNLLEHKSNNCIAAVCGNAEKNRIDIACACLDVSTGEFVTRRIPSGDTLDAVQNEIGDNGIREIIYPEYYDESEVFSSFFRSLKRLRPELVVRTAPGFLFEKAQAEEEIKRQFSVAHSDILELHSELEVLACGAVLSYVRENVKKDISHVRWVKERRDEDVLFVDNTTKKHLELVENAEGGTQATLLSVLDRTKTAMGARLLRKYIHVPSRSIDEIRRRQDRVEFFFQNSAVSGSVMEGLSDIVDIERIVSRLSVGKGNARDLLGLKNSLKSVQKIKTELSEEEVFEAELAAILNFEHIVSRIDSCIVDDPPLSTRDGGMIKSGYSEKLDEYRRVNRENREWIAHYQHDQQESCGIPSLKVRYNRIIGYYIEVTKPNLHLVPSGYMKKQTLVNAERFTTEELQHHEILLVEARENSNALEAVLFEEMRRFVLESMEELYKTASIIAKIDVYCSFAAAARENTYVKPEMVDENIVDIQGGRHPVVERLGEERFIENDLLLNDTDRRIMVLTGPNMAGKSTFLRQCALIILMAHMGSFVPARSARIGIADRVFSRIGMTDRLIKGESTFLVEMIETSRILHYATKRSFIIMDEIGRGTSTYDGLSIAWAVLEYLLDERLVGAKVLFATHYHEITSLDENYGVVNYNATVKEWNNEVVFLRKIVPGCASRSYGVEVAKMAGIPDGIIERAKSILHGLETKYGRYMTLLMSKNPELNAPFSETRTTESEEEIPTHQLGLFPSPYEILAEELKNVEIEKITPLEALNILDRLKKSI